MLNPVGILVVAMMVVTLMSMAVSGSLRRSTVLGVTRWISANAVAVIALVLFALQHNSPLVLSVIVANLLLAFSTVLGYEGCRQFFHLRPATALPYGACAGLVLGLAYWTYVSPNPSACIVVVSMFYAYLHASIGWTAWMHRSPIRSFYGCCFIVAVASISAVGHVVRGLVYASGFMQPSNPLLPGDAEMAFPIVGILALPGLSMGMVMLVHDRLTEQFERWANVDELTGAVTRRYFFARAQEMIEQAAASDAKLSVAIVDLDHFKSINDEHGHAAGDNVLAHFGRLARAKLREKDVFGRIGGEEFAILFAQASRQDARSRMDELREWSRFDRRKAQGDMQEAPPQAYSFSAGVDEYRHGDTLLELLARADAALYSAKTQGRDRIVDAQDVCPPVVVDNATTHYGLGADTAASGK